MTNLEQSIKNALPDLMELGVGTIFNYIPNKESGFTYEARICDISGGGQIADTGDYSDVVCGFISNYNGYEELDVWQIEEKFDIIGKPITLPDVLRWINLISENYFLNSVRRAELLDLWDLTIPNLSDQQQPVKDFLSNLIQK